MTPQPYRRLRPDLALGLRRDACLAVNFDYAHCEACVRACPAGALEVRAGEIVVGGACVSCGRCAAACETGALRLEACDLPHVLPAEASVVRVECGAVAQDAANGALQVACIEGVPVSQWLALVLAAAGRPIEVVDRGWCAHCAAGGAPADGSLARACSVLMAAGVAAERLPRRRTIPSPVSTMRRAPAAAPAAEALSRRGFFGRIARGATAAATTATAGMAEPPGPAKRAGELAIPERERRLALLRALAGGARAAQGYPFAILKASDECRDHGVCAAVCPTGALRRYSCDQHGGLEFEAVACIECAACIDACSREALAFGPRQPALTAGALPITRRALQPCRDCGSPTTDTDALCRTCRDCAELARDGAAELFSATGHEARA